MNSSKADMKCNNNNNDMIFVFVASMQNIHEYAFEELS